MKTMTVSRQSHPVTFKKCKTLGQLIASIEKEGEQESLFVVKIFLNGKKMDHEEENLLDGLSINEIQNLEVQMSTMKEIIGHSIADIISAIQDVQLTAIRFCQVFRTEQTVDDEKVKFVLVGCRSIINSLEEIFTAHTTQKFMIKHHSLWLEAEKELTNILQCILQSRQMSEVDFLCDLIEYDLVQALDQWDEVLEQELTDNPCFTGIFSLKTNALNSDNGVDA